MWKSLRRANVFLRLLTGSAHVGGRVGGVGPRWGPPRLPRAAHNGERGFDQGSVATRPSRGLVPRVSPTTETSERSRHRPSGKPRPRAALPSPTVGPAGVWSRMSVARVGCVRFLVTSPLTFLRAPHGVDPTRSDDMISHAPPGPARQTPASEKRDEHHPLFLSLSLSLSLSQPLLPCIAGDIVGGAASPATPGAAAPHFSDRRITPGTP